MLLQMMAMVTGRNTAAGFNFGAPQAAAVPSAEPSRAPSSAFGSDFGSDGLGVADGLGNGNAGMGSEFYFPST